MESLRQNISQKSKTNAVLTKAIGHPARIAIIQHLIKVNSCVCGEIVQVLPLGYRFPTFEGIKNAGIIKGNLEGNAICYCLNEEGFKKIKGFFENINSYLENKIINVANFKTTNHETIRN
jgi:hypothetical protein